MCAWDECAEPGLLVSQDWPVAVTTQAANESPCTAAVRGRIERTPCRHQDGRRAEAWRGTQHACYSASHSALQWMINRVSSPAGRKADQARLGKSCADPARTRRSPLHAPSIASRQQDNVSVGDHRAAVQQYATVCFIFALSLRSQVPFPHRDDHH